MSHCTAKLSGLLQRMLPPLRACLMILPVLPLLALHGCDLEHVEFAGAVELLDPLSGATIALRLLDTDDAESLATCTSAADGSWQVDMLILSAPLRVVSSGGTHDGSPFDGQLSAYIPHNDAAIAEEALGYHAGSILINVLTTFVDLYMLQESCNYEMACEHVAHFFQIPLNADLTSEEETAAYFSTAELLFRAQTNGGFDAYVEHLLLLVDSGDFITMLPDTSKGYEIIESTLGTWAGNKLMSGVVGAGANFALGKAWSLLLPALGFETVEQGMARRLDEIQAELSAVHHDIGVLDTKVESLMNDLHISTAEILDEVNRSDLTEWRRLIQNQFNNFIFQFGPEAAPSSNDMDEFAHAICDSGNLNFDQVLFNLNDAMVGTDLAGVLTSYSRLLAEQILVAPDKGIALKEAYVAYEHYFGDLIVLYLRGVTLYCNAKEYLSVADHVPGARTQAYWDSKVNGHLDDQVDAFLEGVERMLTAAADTRTIMTGKYSMFPLESAEILARADFAAAQFSSKHDFGLVVRVLGDPTISDALCTKPVMSSETKITSNENNLGAPAYAPIHTVNTREWPYPTYRAAQNYLGWSGPDNNKAWTYSLVNTIAFAKMTFPQMSATLLNAYQSKAGSHNFRRVYKTAAGAECSVLYQMLDRATGKAAAKETQEAVLYGHCVFNARRNPSFVDELKDMAGREADAWNLSVGLEPSHGCITAELKTSTPHLFSHPGPSATAVGYLGCVIKSATTSPVPLTVQANVKTQVTVHGLKTYLGENHYHAFMINTHATTNLEVDHQAPAGSWSRVERGNGPDATNVYEWSEMRTANLVQKQMNELKITTRSTVDFWAYNGTDFRGQVSGANFRQTADQYEIMFRPAR